MEPEEEPNKPEKPEKPNKPDEPKNENKNGVGEIRNRFEDLYDYSEKDYKEIINFNDVKKGNIYVNLIHYDKNLKKNENFEYYRYFSIKK